MLTYRLNEVEKINCEAERDFARLTDQARAMGEAVRQGGDVIGKTNND